MRWQALATKQEFIEKFFNGEECVLENCEEVVYSYNQVKSLATGNPILVEEANLRSELNSLLSQLRLHQQRQFSLSYETKKWISRLTNLEKRLELGKQDLLTLSSKPNPTERKQIGLALNNARIAIIKSKNVNSTLIGKYRSFNIYGHYDGYKKQLEVKLVNNGSYDFNIVVNGNKVKLKASKILDSIDELIELLPANVDSLPVQIEDTRVEISRCSSLQDKQFDGANRINEIKQRLNEIEDIIEERDAVVFEQEKDKEINDELETNENNEFWLGQDKSIAATTLKPQIVEILKQRSTENIEWLSQYITSTQNVEYEIDKSPNKYQTELPKIKIETESIKQLDLFSL